MSGVPSDHEYHSRAMWSCAVSMRRSCRSDAATDASSTTIAIAVSSVHSPGCQPSTPPPIMPISSESSTGGWNSYGAPSASPVAAATTAPIARCR